MRRLLLLALLSSLGLAGCGQKGPLTRPAASAPPAAATAPSTPAKSAADPAANPAPAAEQNDNATSPQQDKQGNDDAA